MFKFVKELMFRILRLFIPMNSEGLEYKAGAKCEDCGKESIVELVGKPVWEVGDGYCDECGCPWINSNKQKWPYKSWLGHQLQNETVKQSNIISSKPTNLNTFKRKEVAEPKSHIYASPYPDDYKECDFCGYDHKYDAVPAARKHG
jgi:hypothetical protein